MIDFRVGDCREVLRTIDDGVIHLCVTSPPYLSLRDYGLEPTWWGVTDPSCLHELGEATDGYCARCGAWRGVLGLEPSIGQYVANVVEVFAEVHRVLHPEGVVFLNLGDSFARDWKKGQHKPGDPGKQAYVYEKGGGRASATLTQKPRRGIKWEGSGEAFGLVPRCSVGSSADGVKEGDLCFVPHRVAMALQAWGWYVRDEIVWTKPNVLSQSVKNRTTRQHEFIFMLTKQQSGYYYDEEPIREPAAQGEEGDTRRPRSVWPISVQPLKENHFAAYPERLVEKCVLVGTSELGCCARCGRQWRRILEKGEPSAAHQRTCGGDANGNYDGENQKDYKPARAQAASDVKRRILASLRKRETTGWRPACRCGGEPLPSIVLDPFSGSGRTGLVAKRLGRDALLIDAKADYVSMAKKLCGEG